MKEKLYLILAVFGVLFGAYGLGHRSAQKSNDLKRTKEERDALRITIETKNEVKNEMGKVSGDDARVRLRSNWLRK